MAEKKKILVTGFNTVDIVFGIDGEVENGQKMYAKSMKEYCGGQAANCAYTLSKLGNDVVYVGRFGDDDKGIRSIESLKIQGIDILNSEVIKNCNNHIGIIFIDELSGERTIVMRKDERLSLDDFMINRNCLKNVELVYSDGNESLFTLKLFKVAREMKISTVLDIEKIDNNIIDVLPYVTVLIAPGNIVTKLSNMDRVEDSVKKLNKMIKIVVATLGNEGSIGIGSDEKIIKIPAKKCKVKDTTGAGDAYHAGFISAIMKGENLSECMKIATNVAAMKCETYGPRII